jgi:hypothetical protein
MARYVTLFQKTGKLLNAQQTIELRCIKRVFSDKAIRICEDVVHAMQIDSSENSLLTPELYCLLAPSLRHVCYGGSN